MTLALREARDDERDALVPAIQAGYEEDMVVNGGFDRDEARRKAEADVPQALAVPGQSFFVLERDGNPVGHLWVAEREAHGARMLFIYDVVIDEPHRGQGLGRDAMLLAEAEARRRGVERVVLNVFGGNEVARNLYRSLAYEEVGVLMRKRLA